MLFAYRLRGTSLERNTVEPGQPAPEGAVWFDLVSPTTIEEKTLEQALGIAIPTREEMQEIEISSRLYRENGARYMTASLLCRSDTPNPIISPVTFILSAGRLLTVRYEEPRPFTIIAHKLSRMCPVGIKGEMILMQLLDAIIDRAADILEKISAEVDRVARDIFEPNGASPSRTPYKTVLISIGRQGDLTSKARESLVSIGRLVLFLANEAEDLRWAKDERAQLKTMQRDVQSLSDHATYLSNKITFLLDAMLGVVGLQQNNIIKIFSVVAVVLMPPTLVASIYGMNFRHMPELDWTLGYPIALGLMVLAAVLPYMFFKWKRWL